MDANEAQTQAAVSPPITITATNKIKNGGPAFMTYAVSNRKIQEIAPPTDITATSPPDTTKASTASAAIETTTTDQDEEAVAHAAMQEAASILMEADQKKRAASSTAKGAPTNKKQRTSRVGWETRMEQLAEYKKEHGNLLIPIRYKHNPSLGKFVHNTREQYKLFHKMTPAGYKKRCSLTAERIHQLHDLGFVFTTERTKHQNEDWNGRLKQLEEYVEKHGDAMVPHGYKEDPSFGEWVHRQRTSYTTYMRSQKKKLNTLLEGRIEKLKAVGFNFTVHEDKWLEHFEQLKEYRQLHGDCQVPTHYAANPKLGRWVHTQRHQNRLRLKGQKSCMTPERFAMLNELDFAWVVRATLERPRATWQQRLEELIEFHQANGHFKIDPASMPQLNKFCLDQRYRLRLLKKNGGRDVTKRMGSDRVSELTTIGFTGDTELLDKQDGPQQLQEDDSIANGDKSDASGSKDDSSQHDQKEKSNKPTSAPPGENRIASV